MQVIPVLDLKDGVVVRGVAGRRAEYRPIVSGLVSSADPLVVAEAFRSQFGLTHLYLADLDAIAGQPPAFALFTALGQRGFQLWVDAGVCDVEEALALAQVGIAGVVVGLETVAGPEALAAICRNLGANRTIFSLDLRDGVPLGNLACWQRPDAEGIAAQAAASGVRSMIVLDLARVGMGRGAGTEDLCRRLSADHPDLSLIAGGGVQGSADLTRLAQCGVKAALVASALHDGRLTADEVRCLAWKQL